VLAHEREPVELIEAWQGAEAIWIIDAVSAGGRPGELHRLDASAQPLPAALFGVSTHRIGLGQTIELSRALGTLPPRVIVHGVEGADFDTGARVSAAVTPALEHLVEVLVEELAQAAAASERHGASCVSDLHTNV
jgi:hydrogenase maturation protease